MNKRGQTAERKHGLYYHYRQALGLLDREAGGIPRRLFALWFPLYRVTVQGHERKAEDYEELEWFIVRAIAYAQLDNVPELYRFYGLEQRLVQDVVYKLLTIGHLEERDGTYLCLTPLGRESLNDQRRYEEYDSSQWLYFDAFTCQPLPREYYPLAPLGPEQLLDDDHALRSFAPWQDAALQELTCRSDRARFNVHDEILSLTRVGEVSELYLPMYIVQTLQLGQGVIGLCVFTNIRDKRDHFFESVLVAHPEIMATRLGTQRGFQDNIARDLQRMDLTYGDYRLDLPRDGEWRIVVPDHWLGTRRPDGAERLVELGEYVVAGEYCLRIWNEDQELRQRAAFDKVLDQLEKSLREMSPTDVQGLIDRAFTILSVPADYEELLRLATHRRLGQAVERLESIRGIRS